MNDLDDLALLDHLMASSGYGDAAKAALRAAAVAYLDRSIPRADLATAVKAAHAAPAPHASWAVFHVWLVTRASRFCQECRDA